MNYLRARPEAESPDCGPASRASGVVLVISTTPPGYCDQNPTPEYLVSCNTFTLPTVPDGVHSSRKSRTGVANTTAASRLWSRMSVSLAVMYGPGRSGMPCTDTDAYPAADSPAAFTCGP